MKKTNIRIFILLFLCLSTSFKVSKVTSSPSCNSVEFPTLSLILHDTILITNDENFTDYGFPGEGTEGNPYIIDGYNITTTDTNAIRISSTTKYFIIRNCYLDSSFTCISILSVGNNTAIIDNNTCNNGEYGIYVSSSDYLLISNNTCNINNRCIYLSDSNSSTIINNTCVDAGWVYGIYLDNFSPSNIINNSLFNCGFFVEGYSEDEYYMHSFENNTVNGRKLGYFIKTDSFVISDSIYGQIFIVYCNDFIVKNQKIDNTRYGLNIVFCTSVTLINNTCNYNHNGILIEDSQTITMENNTCNNNENCGIALIGAGISNIVNNTCEHNIRGIYVWGADSSSFRNNTCSFNFIGIEHYSDDCVFYFNEFNQNSGYGLRIMNGCDDNTIHHNNFTDNNLGGSSQAQDNGRTSIWYDINTNEGNYWNDWSGIGSYSIDGTAGASDPYPLDEEGNPPIVLEFQGYQYLLILLPCTLLFTLLFRKKLIRNRLKG